MKVFVLRVSAWVVSQDPLLMLAGLLHMYFILVPSSVPLMPGTP